MTAGRQRSGDSSAEALWPEEALRRRRFERYHALNASYDRPFVHHLTKRGFFSEVNIAMDSVLFALTERRRLAVVERRFNKLRWRDYFASELPFVDEPAIAHVPRDEHIHKPKDASFQKLLGWVRGAAGPDARFDIDELGVHGGLFEAKRALCRMFCRPSEAMEAAAREAMARLELEPGRFAAVHLRRGDKIAVEIRNGKAISEGEDTPAWRVAEIIARISPDTREVFVLTDDFAAVDELRRACPGRRVVTLCPPEAAGHDQDVFNIAPREVRTQIIRRLIVECVIAAQSDAFAGGFKSNVAKFVTSIHADPGRCASTDSLTNLWLYH